MAAGVRVDGGGEPEGLEAWSWGRKMGCAPVGGDWAGSGPWGGQEGALKPKPWGSLKEESELHDSEV